MTWVAAIGASVAGTAAIAGGVASSNASKNAAKAQQAAAQQATDFQRYALDKQLALQQPFLDRGDRAGAEAERLLGLSGDVNSEGYGKYASADPGENWMTQIDPGYNFRLSEGLKALNKSLAARGFTPGGGGTSIRGITDYAQGEASQEYQNAFNRYQTVRSNTLNPFLSLAGAGQTAAQTSGAAYGNFGNQAGENAIGAGNARASGYVGSANAWSGALGGVANAGQGYALYNMFNNPAYSGYSNPSYDTYNSGGLGGSFRIQNSPYASA